MGGGRFLGGGIHAELNPDHARHREVNLHPTLWGMRVLEEGVHGNGGESARVASALYEECLPTLRERAGRVRLGIHNQMFRILAELKVDIMDADAGNLTIPVNESSALGSFVGSGRERKQEGDSEHRDDAEGACGEEKYFFLHGWSGRLLIPPNKKRRTQFSPPPTNYLLTQPIFVRYFSRFTTLEHFNVVDATYASIFTRAANNGAGMFVTFFYRVPMLKLNDVHLIDCAFR